MTQRKLADTAVTGGHAVEDERLELLLSFGVLDQVVHCHRATETLTEQDQWFSSNLWRFVQPLERGIDILVNRRQAWLAFRQSVTAIVDQQDLITLLRQPVTAPKCIGKLPPFP